MKRLFALLLAVLCLMHGVGVSEFGGTVVNGLYYSGAAMFDEKTGVLKFVSSGTIQDPGKKKLIHIRRRLMVFCWMPVIMYTMYPRM